MTNFQKITSLIKKTGDKLLILDEKGDPGYIMMSLSAYNGLILAKSDVGGLTEDEFLDKINRDIAIWKDNQGSDYSSVEQCNFKEKIDESSSFGVGYFDSKKKFVANENNNDSEEEEEDRYYFEPVE